jgi:hypothetical protein
LSTDEQETRAPGSVPVAYGNALSWKWTRQMSAYLRRSGLPLLLCQLRNLAAASGEIAFNGDRKPIRIQDIAKAACCDEKDARRYMDAAIRAGVVRVLGERKRGKATRYALIVSPFPDWQAAEDYLRGTARKRTPQWDQSAESSGDSAPYEFGGQRPELTAGTPEEVPGTAPRMSSGDSARNGSGDSAPNNPGGFPGITQERAEVGFQPQVVGAPERRIEIQEDPDDHTTWHHCAVCERPILPDPRRPGRTVHARCEHRERTAS